MAVDHVYFLTSADYVVLEHPRKCSVVNQFKGKHGREFMTLRIDPPVEGDRLQRTERQITEVVVTTRHVGDSLFAPSKYPVFVHVCLPVIEGEDSGSVAETEMGEFYSAVWGELYIDEESARLKRL